MAPAVDDPLAARSAVSLRLFNLYLTWLFYRRFHAVRVSHGGLPRLPPGHPVVVFTNHPSWWDPVLLLLLSDRLLPQTRGFGPMDASALARYGLLRRMGIFGIDPNTRRGAGDFLRISLNTLQANPDAALWVTAEGQFTDARCRPIRLRAGIAHLARRLPEAMFIPLALEYSFWNEARPEALARFGEPLQGGGGSVVEWTDRLEDALHRTMDVLAAESAARDPALFHTMLGGLRGLGGIYDLIRRLQALAAGQRFDPSHEQDRQ